MMLCTVIRRNVHLAVARKMSPMRLSTPLSIASWRARPGDVTSHPPDDDADDKEDGGREPSNMLMREVQVAMTTFSSGDCRSEGAR